MSDLNENELIKFTLWLFKCLNIFNSASLGKYKYTQH